MLGTNRRFLIGAILTGAMLCPLGAQLKAQPPETRMYTTPPLLKTITWEELQQQFELSPPVTLHAEKMPLSEVIEKLNAQLPASLQIESYAKAEWKPLKEPMLSADYNAQSLWTVKLDIMQKMGVNLDALPSTDNPLARRTIIPRIIPASGFSVIAEPLFLSLQSTSYQNSLNFNRDETKANERLWLNGSVYSNPVIQWNYDASDIKIAEAIDDTGQSLALNNMGAPLGGNMFGNYGQLNFNLKPPARRGGTLKRLRGTLYGAVTLASEQWEVEDVLNAKNLEKIFEIGESALQVELQGVEQIDDAYRVTLKTTLRSKNYSAQARLSTGKQLQFNTDVGQTMRLLDAEGRELVKSGGSSSGSGIGNQRIHTSTMTFMTGRGRPEDRTGPPAKLVFTYSTDWRELAVPFEFKDIPLP